MKMNTHLNIEDVAGSIVVPVWCGSERGTAFFISPTKLLTAFHVVAEYVADDSDIFINVNGITAECTCEELAKGKDIAILTCVSYKMSALHIHYWLLIAERGKSCPLLAILRN